MDVLTPLQRRLLSELGRSELGRDFILTGGTALAACYLRHRTSEDLDLFTSNPRAVPLSKSSVESVAQALGLAIRWARTFETFHEAFLETSSETIKVQLALDSPFRFGPPEPNDELGIRVENLLDLACNKLSALFGRAAPKDLVDIYFLTRRHFDFFDLLAKAKEKHVGLDEYWLAQALLSVREPLVLPRMIVPFDLARMVQFYEDLVPQLIARGAGAEK